MDHTSYSDPQANSPEPDKSSEPVLATEAQDPPNLASLATPRSRAIPGSKTVGNATRGWRRPAGQISWWAATRSTACTMNSTWPVTRPWHKPRAQVAPEAMTPLWAAVRSRSGGPIKEAPVSWGLHGAPVVPGAAILRAPAV
jgi:hypothetical protein